MRKLLGIIFVILIFVFTITGCDSVPTTGSVYGTIKDIEGGTLEGVVVEIGNKSVTTDSDGYYEIADLKTGSYNLNISKEGFTKTKSVAIKGDQNKIDVVMAMKEIALVTDVAGLGDESFNDAAYKGLKDAEEELAVKTKVVESSSSAEYTDNLSKLAEDYDMVWAVGFLMQEPLNQVAPSYPDTSFGIIDDIVNKENVISCTFKEHQGSFLVGLIAGLKTEKGKVGFIGGMRSPLIEKFEAGYTYGVEIANSNCDVLVDYVGAYDDSQKGKNLAVDQFNEGADIIYHAAGASGIGVIEAAEQENHYAIGVDSPQNHLAPDHVLTSMIKKIDAVIYNEIKNLCNDNLKTGHKEYGLEKNGVGFYYPQAEKMLSQDILNQVEKYRQKVINGDIEVPSEITK